MANAIYAKWKQGISQGNTSCLLNGSGTTGVYAALVDTDIYTYSSTDQYYTALAGAVIGTDQEITNKTYTNGVLGGSNVTFPSVTGPSAEAIVLYVKNAGASSTWQLLAYLDTNVSGLPVTPNGGDIETLWNASGIFAL